MNKSEIANRLAVEYIVHMSIASTMSENAEAERIKRNKDMYYCYMDTVHVCNDKMEAISNCVEVLGVSAKMWSDAVERSARHRALGL